MIRIRRGVDLPLAGAAGPPIEMAPPARRVALVGDDYVGLRPRLLVEPGDRVRAGQPLLRDKTTGVPFASPGSGEVVAVERGARRRLLSVVVRLEGDEQEEFDPVEGIAALDREAVRERLVASGLWTALRARPFGRIPDPATAPRSLFVTAIDSRPLAPDPQVVLEGRDRDFEAGLQALGKLSDGPVRLCTRPGASIPGDGIEGVERHEFAGPHPAGLPGTHIHFLDPVGERKTVWHVGYQDVAAAGALFRTGRLPLERVVALGGPMVERPALVRTRLGASTDELLAGRLRDGPRRVISGSVLAGRTAEDAVAFLGRYDHQVSVVSDARAREFLGWMRPGRAHLASLLRRFQREPTTARQGEPRALLPIGRYETVLPLDVLPAPLFRALAAGDVERAIDLGCLELVEEDLALCAFVCPSKSDFGGWLRDLLTRIEKEG